MSVELRCGPDERLDEIATEILLQDRYPQGRFPGNRGIPPRELEHDWLSPDQLKMRENREVLNLLGVVGEYPGYTGLYRRAYNPLINRRPSLKLRGHHSMDPWCQLLYEAMDSVGYIPARYTNRQAKN